jgi:type I restriction enzyme S subunit
MEFQFLPKTGRPASFGTSDGPFPFFTSSQDVSKRTTVSDCTGPALVFGTGGAASIHYVEGHFSATNDCYVAVPKSSKAADAKYVYHYLRTHIQLIESGFRGAGLKHVTKKHLEAIPLPDEMNVDRERINAILDKAYDIRGLHEQACTLTDNLIRSVFVEMFGDPILNAKGIQKKPLSEFGKIVTGNTPPRSDPENYGDVIEWIKSDNVNTEEHFLTRAVEGLSAKGKLLGRIVPKGSILVTCIAGSPSSIGKAAIADRPVALNQQINAITPYKGVNLYFLYAQFLIGKPLIMRSSTNSMKGMVSKGEFQKIEFLRPEPSEQEKFGKIFEKQIKARWLLREASIQATDLFNSLSHRAFRGKL